MSVDQLDNSVAVTSTRPDLDRGVRRRWLVARRRPASRTVAVLQHLDHAPGGALLDVLSARGLDPGPIRVDRDESLPDPGSVRIAVVLGSDQSAREANAAWIDRELDWLREADRAGTPVLAVGSGAQVLATALGGGVERVARPRRGWIRVTSAAPQLIAAGPWLVWDDVRLRPPASAELLAHDYVGAQAFRIKRHVGVQFHPEVTPKIVSDWVASSDEVLDVQGLMEATQRDFTAASRAAQRLFGAFIDSVARP